MWLFLMCASMSACGVESEPEPASATAEQAVSAPNAHCVLCGEDGGGGDGGGGGGGTYGVTVDWMNETYPGWSGSISCHAVYGVNGLYEATACDTDFTWHSIPGQGGCSIFANNPTTPSCDGTI
jgi:hypothetical protein